MVTHGLSVCQSHSILLLYHADQQWAHSATALQQALTTLATARPSKRLRKDSSPRRSTDTQQGDGPSSALAAAGSATPTGLAQQADPVGNPGGDPGATPVGNPAVGGSALHRGDPSGTHATTAGGVDSAAGQSNRLGVNSNSHDGWRVGQGAAGQAFYFAHDLLGNPAAAVHAVLLWGPLTDCIWDMHHRLLS